MAAGGGADLRGYLVRASLRYASKRDWAALTRDLRTIDTATDEAAAAAALDSFAECWQARYPAIVRLWRAHWTAFVPFLAFPPQVRRVIYTTNLIENARLRKVTRTRGQFPSEQAALKVLYWRCAASTNTAGPTSEPEAPAETGGPSVHDLLRGTDPHPMTPPRSLTQTRTPRPGLRLILDTPG
jgi:Transposase, Mutator family